MFSRSMRLEKPYSIKLKSKLRIVSRMIKSSQLRKFPNATKISIGWNSHFWFLLSLSVSLLNHAIYCLFNLVYSLGSIRMFVAFFFLLCCILYCKGKNFALERFWALSTLPEHFLCSCSAQPSEAFSTFSAEVFGFFFFFLPTEVNARVVSWTETCFFWIRKKSFCFSRSNQHSGSIPVYWWKA